MPISYNGSDYSFEELQSKVMSEKKLSKKDAGAYVASIENKQKEAKLLQRFSKIIKTAKEQAEIKQGENDDMIEDEQAPFISEGTGDEESSSKQITTKKSPGSED